MISKEKILQFDTRKKIYNFIKNNPGLHIREVQRKTKIPLSTLSYHFNYLEKQNLIIGKLENKYKRYVVADKFSKIENDILILLRQEVPRNILVYMFFYHVFSQSELSKALEKNPTTIEFHLKKLMKLGLIKKLEKNESFDEWLLVTDRKRVKSEVLYIYKSREIINSIYPMLIICKESYSDRELIENILVNFDESVDKIHIRKTKRKLPWLLYRRVNNPNLAIDSAINLLYEACPHPYHV